MMHMSGSGKWRMVACQMIAIIIQWFKDCLKTMICQRQGKHYEMFDNGFSTDATTTIMIVDLLCRDGIDLLSSDKAKTNKEITSEDVK